MKTAFKLKSGNNPSVAKLAGVSPMKDKVKGHDGKSLYTQEQVDNMSSLDRNRYLNGVNRGSRSGDYDGIKVPRVGEEV